MNDVCQPRAAHPQGKSIRRPGLPSRGYFITLTAMLELRFLPTRWTLALPPLCLLSAAVFGLGAISLPSWSLGAVSLLLLVFAVVTLRTRRRLLAAAKNPADAPPSTPVTPAAPGLPAVLRATQTTGLKHRDGFLVLDAGFAAFVPTEDWSNLAVSIAVGLVATTLPLAKPELMVQGGPLLRAELQRLVRERDGFFLSDAWQWNPFLVSQVMMILDKNTLTVRDAPLPLFARWPRAADTPQKSRTVRKLILIIGGLGAGLIGVGALAWHLTGNADFFIAGLVWGLVLLGALTAGLILARRAQRKP